MSPMKFMNINANQKREIGSPYGTTQECHIVLYFIETRGRSQLFPKHL